MTTRTKRINDRVAGPDCFQVIRSQLHYGKSESKSFCVADAPEHPNVLALRAAIFFAEYAIRILPIIIWCGWLKSHEGLRKLLLESTTSGLGLLIAQIIGLVWSHPRPFMIGIGHTLISHVADSSFPSDHLTLLWAISFSFLLHRSTRMAGLALAVLGLPMAWARIYVGVHFPLDMVGAALVAIFSAGLASLTARVSFLPLTAWQATAISAFFGH
jgi:undecaprenyl-diphosphatase